MSAIDEKESECCRGCFHMMQGGGIPPEVKQASEGEFKKNLIEMSREGFDLVAAFDEATGTLNLRGLKFPEEHRYQSEFIEKILHNYIITEIDAHSLKFPYASPGGFVSLLESLKLPNLRKLNVGSTPSLTFFGRNKVVESVPKLEWLDVSNIGMHPDYLYTFLIQNGFFRNLRYFNVSDSTLNHKFRACLAAIPASTQLPLEELVCENVGFTEMELNTLANAIPVTNRLKRLSLARNTFNTKEAEAVARIVKLPTSLEELDVSCLDATMKGLELICQALTLNTTLKRLDISGNRLNVNAVKALRLICTRSSQYEFIALRNISLRGKDCIAWWSELRKDAKVKIEIQGTHQHTLKKRAPAEEETEDDNKRQRTV